MAEPVFEDGDPLGKYLKEAGDTMPGHSDPTPSQDVLWNALTSAFQTFLSYLQTHTPLTHEHHATPFAERFKYDIISSSLLATTADFAPLRPGSGLGSPAFPGALGHSRGSSISQDHQYQGPVEQGQDLIDRNAPRAPARGQVDFKPLAALGLVLVILSAGYHVLAVLTLLGGGAIFLGLNSQSAHLPVAEQVADARQEEDKTAPNMTALHELIVAGSIWDAIVHSAIALLESEESAPSSSFSSAFSSVPHTSVSPSFPHNNTSINSPTKSPTKLSSSLSPASLALRGALQSALSMTHAHCDSVRALLSALTLPGELAQMAEMYAPPSPGHSRFLSARDSQNNLNRVFGGALSVGRPVSLPGSKFSTPSRDRERRVKRATWDGHLAAQQNNDVGGSPNVTLRKRRAGRRTGEMMSLDLGPSQAERSQGEEVKGEEDIPFGPAALGLHRTRKTSGLSQLLSPAGFEPSTPQRRATAAPATPPSMLSTYAPYTPYTPRTPFAGASPAYGGRHHLSLGALHSALAGALASKRFACAHLLALRFDEEDMSSCPTSHSHSSRAHSRCPSRAQGSSQDDREDEEEKEREREAYWEDVRSVMSLLASTLSDTAASLGEALAEAEEQRRQEGNPTPTSEGYSLLPHSQLDPDASFSVVGGSDIGDDVFDSPKGMRQQLLLDALNLDGRQGEGEADGFAPAPSRLSRFAAHVGAIQAALDGAKEDLDECVAAVRQSTSGSGAEVASSGEADRSAEEEAMMAYERMRRELGLALRECERGREKLAELISTRSSSTAEDAEEEGDGVPELAEDSDRSDKHDSVGVHTRTPTVEFHTDPLIAAPDPHYPDDDAVPPMGAEQVYEAEPEPAVAFNRERSKLTREERIRLTKAKRDSGLSLLDYQETEQNDSSQQEAPWSHGVDVVQELKDVIWQVGERRRKLAEVEL